MRRSLHGGDASNRSVLKAEVEMQTRYLSDIDLRMTSGLEDWKREPLLVGDHPKVAIVC